MGETGRCYDTTNISKNHYFSGIHYHRAVTAVITTLALITICTDKATICGGSDAEEAELIDGKYMRFLVSS